MQQYDWEKNSGKWFKGGNRTGLGRFDIFYALEIRPESKDSAEKNNEKKTEAGAYIPNTGKNPRGAYWYHDNTTDEHGPAYNKRWAPVK